jgi:hypothetical protein
MPEDDRQLGRLDLCVPEVEVGAADATSGYAKEHLVGTGLRIR